MSEGLPNGNVVKSWWPVLVTVVVFAVGYGGLTFKVDALADDVATHVTKGGHSTVKEQMVAVVANQSNIKEDVVEIKDDIEDIKTEQRANTRVILEALAKLKANEG